MVAPLFGPCQGLQRQGSSLLRGLEPPWMSPDALPLPGSHIPGALFEILKRPVLRLIG